MAGDGVAKDPVEAADYYRLAAEQGDTLAQAHLGLCHLTGNGVDQDLEEAVRLFREAQGDPVAQFNLGVCLAKGQGVALDMEAAVMDCSYVWRRRRKYDIDITRDAILSMHHADCRGL